MDDLLAEFLSESQEAFALLGGQLKAFRQNPDNAPLIAGLSSLMHTIHGACRFLNLPRLATLSLAMEQLLEPYRNGSAHADEKFAKLVLEGVEDIRSQLLLIEENGAEEEGDDAALIARLAAMSPATDVAAIDLAEQKPETELVVPIPTAQTSLLRELGELRDQLLSILKKQPVQAFAQPLLRLDQITTALLLSSAEAPASSQAKAPLPMGEQTVQDKLRLLLIDNSAFFRNLLTPFLQAHGYAVTTVSNGKQALKCLEQEASFHAILCDLDMQEMNGLAFAAKAKETKAIQAIPLIALGSQGDLCEPAAIFKAGFAAVIGKFERDKLLRCIANKLALPDQRVA